MHWKDFSFFLWGVERGGWVFWKKRARTNDCWILICIVVPKLRWMTPTFLCQLKQSVGVRDSRSPPPMGERGGGWAGGGGWVRNHKPATSAGNRMHFICIRSCMIHQHHFTRVQNITFSLQMLIYDKQLIWETSELGSIKDPLTFTSFCPFACPTCADVFGQCGSRSCRQLSSWAGGIPTITKIITE